MDRGTGWGNFIEGLESHRFDAFCAPLWRNGARGMHIAYTVPMAYSAQHIYVRKGDVRFDRDIMSLNDSRYKFATMDGEMSAIIATRFFPKAQQVSIPQLGDISQLLLAVSSGKADAVVLEPGMAKDYADKNPGRITRATRAPFNVFPDSYGVRLGETKLQTALDSAIVELVNQGVVDQIITRYEPDRSMFMPLGKPYQYVEPNILK